MLTANNLSCERGERLLFRNLDLELNEGEALLVRGANGHGKTSLLRILCGLSLPASGQVLWRGEPIRTAKETFGKEMAYVAHSNGIKEEFTPLENMTLSAQLGGRDLDLEKAESTLAQLGLARCMDLPARVLSFGQRRRVTLAGLLTAGTLLWILDEPLTGLDVNGVAMVEQMIRDHIAAGGMVIATTHHALELGDLMPKVLTVGEQA